MDVHGKDAHSKVGMLPVLHLKTPSDREALVRQKELWCNCLGYHKSAMYRIKNKCCMHEVFVSKVITHGVERVPVSAVASTQNQT